MTSRPTARRLLRAGAVLSLAGAAVGGGVAAATPTVYSATSTSVLTARTFPTRESDRGWAPSLTGAYAAAATRPLVLGAVIRDLGLRTTPERLADVIDVDSGSDSQLIRISATDPSPARAASIANRVQAELARQSGSMTPPGTVRIAVVEQARAPLRASAPDVLLDVVGGAGSGLLLGVVVLAGIGAVRAFRRPSSGGLAAPSML